MASRIVLVEDDHLQTEMLSVYLEDLLPGSTVQVVSTEQEFRQLLPDFRNGPPDLIIIDLMIRWANPSPQAGPIPEDVLREGYYRAGSRCQQLLASGKATQDIPVILYSVMERVDAFKFDQDLPNNVFYLQKSADASTLGRLAISLLVGKNPELVHRMKKVFIVHGHDLGARESVARLLQRLAIDFVILSEQIPNGRTIIEQFEKHANSTDFAVILLTPDDVGAPSDALDQLKPRARQNVIFELGYFSAKLGRGKTCALLKSDMEAPSDYGGIIYIKMDVAGAWQISLARQLRAAGFSVDLNSLA